MQAAQRKMELEAQGKQVTLVREEPFTTAQDSVEYNVYLMIWTYFLTDNKNPI